MSRDFDVLVAGAGPAGAHTALRLAHKGWRVALIDARTFPRKKPCGEFLSPACLPLLEELDLLEPLEDLGAVHVVGMRLHTGSVTASGAYVAIGSHHPPTTAFGHGLGIRRELLDELAVRKAQEHPCVQALLGWRVHAPLHDASARVIGLSVTDSDGSRVDLGARFVVAADGGHSRVAQGMGWDARLVGAERFAIVARFRGVPAQREAELHVLPNGDYFAACPIDSGLFTANLVVDRRALEKGRATLARLFAERLTQAPHLQRRLAGAELEGDYGVCGPLRSLSRRISAPGVALVGDACRFVDPLTGEGLFFAMRGAQLLATAVDLALRDANREAEALAGYERDRRREFGPRYGLAELLQRGLRRKAVPRLVLRCLARRPGLCDLLLGLTGDYVPPRALLSPRVWLNALLGPESVGHSGRPSGPGLLADGPRAE